jgi:ferredoxin, 2Fe-2S
MPTMTFVTPEGTPHQVEAPPKLSVLEVARRNRIDLEGDCGGSCACSTCHVVVDAEHFARIPDASEEEEDILDLAFGVAETSRLACQIFMADNLDGLTVRIPPATRNFGVTSP